MTASHSSALRYIEIIQSKTKHNQQLTSTIFNKLFEELPEQISIIASALKLQRYRLAQDTAHKLHGSVSFCDLDELRQAAQLLENCLAKKNYSSANFAFADLQKKIGNFLDHQQIIFDLLGA
jgi:HPt (histidine-containing phosphotransfer) domain-containing protein